MTDDQLERLAEGLAELAVGGCKKGVNDNITNALSVVIDAVLKVEKLEARVAALEASGVKYRGVWQAAEEYRRGDMVTHGGSVFHCNADKRAKPGNGSTTWSLAVKHGKDAEPRRVLTGVRGPTGMRRP
jgi:hypothetical protein